MSKQSSEKIVSLSISSFSKKGNGFALWERPQAPPVKVEVPFAIPGDQVQVSIKRKRSGTCQGQLLQLEQASPDRIVPRCLHFATCGGCRWQQLSYEKQLALKEELVHRAFDFLLNDQVKVHPIIPCDPPWQYRNKMEYTFSQDASKQRYLGLIIDSSKGKVLSLSECHLVNSWFIDTLHSVRKWWAETNLEAYHPYSNRGSLRTLTVREGQRTGDRMVVLLVSGNPDYALNKTQIESFASALRSAIEPTDGNGKLSLFLRIQQVAKGKPTQFYEVQLYGPDHIREVLHISTDSSQPPEEMPFTISPSAFFQPNTRQAEKLYSLALQMAQIPEKAIVYDLYCGTGTLGICAAKRAQQVIGIELSPESALDARTNASLNQLSNISILTGDVGTLLAEKKLPAPDVTLVDPPRVGLDEQALKHLAELRSPKLIYISCNPMSQAENIKILVQQGYRLLALQPVDQFPHTVHIENIALLGLSK